MRNIETEIANEEALSATGEAALADTVGSRDAKDAGAAFYLNITVFVGTTADFTIVGVVDGVEYILATFTQAAGVTHERKAVTNCPDIVKVKYTLASVTDLDYTVTCIRR